MDYYETLGVNHTTSPAEVKKAYKRLASKHHPDKGGDEAQFKKIQEAYETLSDPEKRQQYDNPNPFDQFSQQGSPFGDIFGDIFGNRRHNAYQRQAKNPDGVVDVTVTFLQAYQGADIVINTNVGSYNLNIPKGISTGSKLRMAGKGPQRYKDLPPGDLIVRIHIDYPENWGSDSVDIFFRHDMNVLDALTGTDFNFTFIDNRKIKIKIPKGVQNGHKLRIKNYGMQDPSRGLIGNLYIICNLIVPDNLSDDMVELVNKIKQESNGL